MLKEKRHWSGIFEMSFSIVGGLYVATRFLALIGTDGLGTYTNWRTWVAVGTCFGAYVFTRFTLIAGRKFWKATFGSPEKRDQKEGMNQGYFMVLYLAAMLGSIGTYATEVYPHLLPQYGGGHADKVVLLPNAEGLDAIAAIGLPERKLGKVGPVQLLMEDDHDLIFVPDGETHAVTIARNLIEAVYVYAPADKGDGAVPTKRNGGPSVATAAGRGAGY